VRVGVRQDAAPCLKVDLRYLACASGIPETHAREMSSERGDPRRFARNPADFWTETVPAWFLPFSLPSPD